MYLRTQDCPPFPPHFRPRNQTLPLANYPNDFIDAIFTDLIRDGLHPSLLPTTQFGRRVALKTFLAKH